jgi:hypothetical protein
LVSLKSLLVVAIVAAFLVSVGNAAQSRISRRHAGSPTAACRNVGDPFGLICWRPVDGLTLDMTAGGRAKSL